MATYYLSSPSAPVYPGNIVSGNGSAATPYGSWAQFILAVPTLNPGDTIVLDWPEANPLTTQISLASVTTVGAAVVSTTAVQAPTFYSAATSSKWVSIVSRYPTHPATIDTTAGFNSGILLTDVNGVYIGPLNIKLQSLIGSGGTGYNTGTAHWNGCIEFYATTTKTVRSQGLSINGVVCNGGNCGVYLHADHSGTTPLNGLNYVEVAFCDLLTGMSAGFYCEEVNGTTHNSSGQTFGQWHFSGLKIHDNYVFGNAGNSNSAVITAYASAATGNGIVPCAVNASVVVGTYIEPRTGVTRNLGCLVGYNQVDLNGLNGTQPGSIYTESSVGVAIGWNISSRQLCAPTSNNIGGAIDIGACGSDHYLYSNLNWGNSGIGGAADGNGTFTTNTTNTVAFNAFIAEGTWTGSASVSADVAGGGSPAGVLGGSPTQQNNAADNNYLYWLGNVFMGIGGGSVVIASGLSIVGDGVYAINNIMVQPYWYVLGFYSLKTIPTLIGNSYYTAQDYTGGGSGPEPGFYDYSQTGNRFVTYSGNGANMTTVRTLGGNAVQTKFETYNSVNYGQFVNTIPGVPSAISALTTTTVTTATSPYPTNPRNLPSWFSSMGLMTASTMQALGGAIPWASSPTPYAATIGDPISAAFGNEIEPSVDPGVGNVRLGTNYEINGTLLTGTLSVGSGGSTTILII